MTNAIPVPAVGERVRIRNAAFRIVAESRNLRAVFDYTRKHSTVAVVDIYGPYGDGSGQMGVSWNDGASMICSFASFTVLQQWCKARRMFKGVPIVEHKHAAIYAQAKAPPCA